jgi:hypothetical protein
LIDIYFVKFAVVAFGAAASAALAMFRWERLSRADKYVAILLSIAFWNEIVSFIMALTVKNNYPLLHIYSPVELGLVCGYFSESIPALRKRSVGFKLSLIGLLLATINASYLQPPYVFNSYFLLIEGSIIISLSLYSFYAILMRDDEVVPYPYTIFWVSIILLLYWSLTVAGFGLYQFLFENPIINNVLYMSSVLFYLSLAIVFFNYRKLIPSGA